MRVISGTARGTKINSIDSIETRPTLDRVKESLFNIIQNKLEDAIVLDLFAGSGAIGIECISRGAEKAYFCEKSHQATKMVYENLIKTRLKDKAIVLNKDYDKADIAVKATEKILFLNLLKKDGVIIIETDEKERELKNLTQIEAEIFDIRKYGRANLIFLKRKE